MLRLGVGAAGRAGAGGRRALLVAGGWRHQMWCAGLSGVGSQPGGQVGRAREVEEGVGQGF
jgi:hypothetical protein